MVKIRGDLISCVFNNVFLTSFLSFQFILFSITPISPFCLCFRNFIITKSVANDEYYKTETISRTRGNYCKQLILITIIISPLIEGQDFGHHKTVCPGHNEIIIN